MSWFATPLAPGTPAPDFVLRDSAGRNVRLSELRGRNVVLVFYPGDSTPVCTRQLCELRDRWSDLQDRNVTVLGINPWSEKSKTRFAARHAFPFPLLCDAGQRVAARYNADGLWVRRTVYLVGADGIIRYARRGKPGIAEVLTAAK